MKNENFKVLMWGNNFIDVNMLEKGIYVCETPILYSKDETIENMIDRANLAKDIMGKGFVTEKYFDNLKQCHLVDFNLNIIL